MAGRHSLSTRALSIALGTFLLTAFAVAAPGLEGVAHAASGPSVVSTTSETDAICRAYGGSLSANTEADQTLTSTVVAPDYVLPGQTFNITIKQPFSGFPSSEVSSGISATIVAVYNQISKWQLPSGLTINSVSLAPVDGNTGANPNAGYYVAPGNVPQVTSPDGSVTAPDPNFDPLSLPANERIAIPGTAPAGFFDNTTKVVRLGVLGTGTESSGSAYAGGSIVQPPAITINVTAGSSVASGTDLGIKLAGQLPAGSFTGSQPNNFPAPTNITVNQANATSSDTTWTNPSYVNYVYTTAVAGIIKIVAKAACGPGYESNTDLGTTPPAYYTGPGAIPNGQAPLMNHTIALVGIHSSTPFEGASYITGSSVPASYYCLGYATCTGDVPDGTLLDTSTPGSYTLHIDATDPSLAPTSTDIHYTVADPQAPVASAGAAQTGKIAGTVVTLDGSGTTDPNGPPALPLTYTWTQTGGPAVTLSDAHAVQPTFTVPGADTPSGDTLQFSLTVDNGYQTSSATTSVSSVASTPTVAAPTKTRPGGGTFVEGDVVTLSAAITNPDGTSPASYTYAWVQSSGVPAALSSTTAANPTYVIPTQTSGTAACTSGNTSATANCPEYKVTVTKTNTGKASAQSASLANYSAALPTTPVANAGPAQNVANGGGTVTLDGSASTQANGHAISYLWSQTGGPAVTLSSTTVQKPTFTAPAAGSSGATYTFSLVVKDTQNTVTSGGNTNTSTAATTTVTQVPDHVVASAGPNQTGKVAGNTITLDASASTDPNFAPLSYTWTQVSNGAPTATLSDIHAVKPTFSAPPATSGSGYVAQFNVTATNGGPNPGDTGTSATPVSITVAASTPTVTAPTKARDGGGTTFFTGDRITLSVAITNPDGTNPADYSYVWVQSSGVTAALSSTTAANPTFIIPPQTNGTTACVSGTGATGCPEYKVTVTKINTGKASTQSATLANYASTLATRPVANAGTAQGVKVASLVTLDGSGSTQAQGHPISYLWSQTGGPAVTLSSTTAQQPTFTAQSTPTSYTFSLTVTDTQNAVTGSGTNGKTSTASTVIVTVSDFAAPSASAGSDQSVHVGESVSLSGSASQADGHTLSYSWSQTGGTPVTLTGGSTLTPSFTAPNAPSSLKFTLTATDTQNPNPAAASTTSSAVTITVGDFASPSASAGSDQSVHVGDPVSLSGSASQANGHTLHYSWAQTGGTPVTLTGGSTLTPSFTAPNAPSSLKFTLTATDTQNPNPAAASTTSSAVTITVGDFASPSASAGSDQSVHVGDPVSLSGSASQANGHTLSYSWSQTGGAPVTLTGGSTLTPSFTAPNAPSSLQFTLTATDTQNPDSAAASTTSSAVTITVAAFSPPTADAGPDQPNVRSSAHVTLDGSGSSDPNHFSLTYTWLQTSGPAVTLSDSHAKKPTFIAPVDPATLSFQLTVDNGSFDGQANDSVSIGVAGTPGLDFGAATALKRADGFQGQLPSDAFTVKVTNAGQFAETVTSSMVSGSVTVNGVDESSQITPTARGPVVLKPGTSANYAFTWTHGDTLNIDDSIVLTGCIAFPGDSGTANNCSVVARPNAPIDVAVSNVTLTKVTQATTSNAISVQVRNLGTQQVSPLRADQVVVTVTVGNGAPVTLPTAGSAKLLAPGGATTYKYTWSHGSIPAGTVVTVTATLNITGNTSASSTNQTTRTGTIK